ncbi:bacteriophage holin [Actinomycetospora sp. CA-101289]|uniref:bacteriophage holin n=1 Tax=Actinomycetospora sp. CA-101289 TaxID=3239893 RepID=UPI003D989F73
MPYLWSVVVVVVALVALGLLVVSALRPAQRLSTVAALAGRQMGDEVGMLKARLAALRVRLAQRRG